jgi:putative aldouronate transport system substrate-binding protein
MVLIRRNEKLLKKLLTVAVALLLMLSVFSGCTEKTDNDVAATQEQAEKTTEKEEATAAPEATEPADPIELSFFTQAVTQLDPDSPEIEALEALTNVEVEWIVPPRESFGEQLALILSSKDLPDIINSVSVEQWTEGGEAGAFIDLVPYHDYMPNILEWSYTEGLTQSYIGDKMYAIPRGTLVRGDPYAVRKDWVGALGLEVPTTLDEYYEFMKAFAYDDPDGNGKDDTYALSDQSADGWFISVYSVFVGIFNAMGYGFGWQEDENGQLYETTMVPEFKEAILFVKKLMDEKIIDPNIITNQNYSEPFYNGISGMARLYAGSYGSVMQLVQEKDPDGDIMFIQVPQGADGTVRRVAGSKGSNGWTVVTSSSKNPEAAVAFIDSFLSDEGWDIINYGLEGIDYTLDGDAKVFNDHYADYCVWRKWLGVVRRPTSIPFYIDSNMDSEALAYTT